MTKQLYSPKYQVWINARTRFRLSHMHIQMARELGLNPKKLGKMAASDQEAWKEPLPDYIETLYRKHYHKDRPDTIRSIEEMIKDKKRKKVLRKAKKRQFGETVKKGPVEAEMPVQEDKED